MKVGERIENVDVPTHLGVEAFMTVIKEVIKQPRVQKVIIDKDGRVTYSRVVNDEEEPTNLNVSFDHLQPYHIIRNAMTTELHYPPTMGAAAVIGSMLDWACSRGYTPVGFVLSPNSVLWSWLYFSEALNVQSRDRLFGYATYTDPGIPETALVLCVGQGDTSALVDTKLSIKVQMPESSSGGEDGVSIL